MFFAMLMVAAVPVLEAEELDVITEELEAKAEWTDEDRVRAEALAKLRVYGWGDCVRAATARFRQSAEPVETVVTAILGNCSREESIYEAALILSYRGRISADQRTDLARGVVSRTRTATRELLVSKLVSERLPKER